MRKVLLYMMLFMATTISAQKFTINPVDGGEMEFKVTSKKQLEVTLVSADNKGSSKLIIPPTVKYKDKTYQVVSVEKYALKSCDESLRELSYPETVKEIGAYQFINMSTGNLMGKGLLSGFTFGAVGGFKMKLKSRLADIEITSLRISKNTKEIAPNAFIVSMIGTEIKCLKAHISEIPSFVTAGSAVTFGLSPSYVETFYSKNSSVSDAKGVYAHSTGNTTPVPEQATKLSALTMNSDVDLNLPQSKTENNTTFAIIIANEDYQKESKVEFARNDGQMFATYCKQVLGIPEKNVHLIENATLNNIFYEVDWLKNVCDAFGGDASVIIFYAGHGVPDEATGSSYLLPVDGVGQNIRTCYNLNEFYKTLSEMPTKNLTVFMDACFSGTKRSGETMASARGVAIKSKPAELKGKMVVFSAAQGDETAYSLKDKNHGLFTYFLLKKLKETNGQVKLGELGDYITQQVKRFSIVENGKIQTPSIVASGINADIWRQSTLK